MPNADFSTATVTMTQGGNNVSLFIEARSHANIGDPTLVWQPDGIPSGSLDSDTTYSVTVANVMVGGQAMSFNYDVTLMDPYDLAMPMTLNGPAEPFINGANQYTFNEISQATRYDLRSTEAITSTWTEGAEDATPQIIDQTTGGYDPITSTAQFTPSPRTGSMMYHLTFASFDDNHQSIVIDRVVVPSATSRLKFYTQFRFATVTSRVHADVSTDSGSSWTSLYSRAGNGSGSSVDWDSEWMEADIDLSAYDGQTVTIRIRYSFENGTSIFPSTEKSVGVYFDDVTVTDALELVNTSIQTIAAPASSVVFTPTSAGQYYLQMQAEVAGRYFGFGPALVDNASQEAPPEINVTGVVINSGNVLIDFSLTGGSAGTFSLLRSMDPAGTYTTDGSAGLQEVQAGTSYRFTTPMGMDSQGNFIIRMD